MAITAFRILLSSNDVGATGGHQAGILIPKGEKELREMLPWLDPGIKNPNVWLECIDAEGEVHKFKYLYYNNKHHDPSGTRDEYRVTHMTAWLRERKARAGDFFEISKSSGEDNYRIRLISSGKGFRVSEDLPRIQLRGWRRVY